MFIANADYEEKDSDSIRLQAGDEVCIGPADRAWPDWVWASAHLLQVKAEMPDSTGDFQIRLSRTTCLGSGSKVINSARSRISI